MGERGKKKKEENKIIKIIFAKRSRGLVGGVEREKNKE